MRENGLMKTQEKKIRKNLQKVAAESIRGVERW